MLIASCGNRHGDVDDEAVAMLIASCGNRHGDVDDEAVQVAVGLRLELDLCVRDNCYCGTLVDAHGVHSFVCKGDPGRTSKHHNIIAPDLPRPVFPIAKEPMGPFQADGKHPNGLTNSSLGSAAGSFVGDITVICPLAEYYVSAAAREACAAAELAASRKEEMLQSRFWVF